MGKLFQLAGLLSIVLCLPAGLMAQFEEDFDDGDFIAPLEWMGDQNEFTVNDEGMLQLDAPEAGEAFLYLPTTFPDSAEWAMEWMMDFAPSSSNFLRIYLQLDTPDRSVANGYFIEIGENGSGDQISLFKLENGEASLLGSLTEGAQSEEPAEAYFEALRSPEGTWLLRANYERSPLPSDQKSIPESDPMLFDDGYFGIEPTFTSQRVDKFFFDNISLKRRQTDTLPPTVQDLLLPDEQHLTAVFDEVIDTVIPSEIEVFPNIGSPSSASISSQQPNRLALEFDESFVSGSSYTLILNGIFDTEGNELQNDSIDFNFIVPKKPGPYEVLLHEIMFEPQSGQVLPDVEYIELFNPTDQHLLLDDIRLADQTSTAIFPEYQMAPKGYLIVTDDGETDLFEPFGAVLGIPSLPALNNGGDIVRLKNTVGDLIHEHAFDEASYNDAAKAGEGWSIEMINPLDPCAGASNWTASMDPRRGTPGEINSVTDTTKPPAPLDLTQIFANGPDEISLTFSKGLDPASSTDPENYSISPARMVASATLSEDRQSVTLDIAPGLDTGTLYSLEVGTGLTDCAGQSPDSSLVQSFGIPEQPISGDIVFNEILFDPEVGGEPFIELLNTTDFFIDYGNLFIAYDDGEEVENFAFPGLFSAAPESNVVVTPSPADISNRYTVPHPEWLFEADVPSLDDESGIFRLYRDENGQLVLIDSARYKEVFHAPFLEETEGVSIERLRADSDGFSAENWYSAAEAVGYATPTGENSQSFTPGDTGEDQFELVSKTFSPDGDGFEDQMILQYGLDRSGYKATVDIYDRNGYLIREWIQNRSIGRTGFLRWNGADDEGEKAPMGMYILRIELWHPDGDREVIKKVCAVATALD